MTIDAGFYITKELLEKVSEPDSPYFLSVMVVGDLLTKILVGDGTCTYFGKSRYGYTLAWANVEGEFMKHFTELEILNAVDNVLIDIDFNISKKG